jgi:type IV pilus assembly protein PilQ
MRSRAVASSLVVALAVIAAAPRAGADPALCGPGAKFHGKPIDLDVKDANVHDVFRLLADFADTNLIIAGGVAGKVTLKLARVPWDQVACTVAAVHKLRLTFDGSILTVMPSTRPASSPRDAGR